MKKKILMLLTVSCMIAALIGGCGTKKSDSSNDDKNESQSAEAEKDDAAIPDNDMSVKDDETPIASGELEIVYSDDNIDLAKYKGIEAAAYKDDVDEDYINEYIDSVLMYTYGNDEEGNPLYTVDSLTDDIASELMNGDGTVAEYKDAVKLTLQNESKKYYDEELTASLFQQVVAASTLKNYEQSEVDDYIAYLNDYYEAYAESVNMSIEDFRKSSLGYDTEEAYNEGIKEEAEYNVKTQHVIMTICEQEGYEPTDEDINAMLSKFVEMGYAESEDAVKENLTEKEIRLNTLYYKVLDIIKDNAVVK